MTQCTLLIAASLLCSSGKTYGQALSGEALIRALQHGGYVIVMRHASSPREAPSQQNTDPNNVNGERQLDQAGCAGAIAMGKALRKLKIPIGEVCTSPTYRARETAQLAQLSNPRTIIELGDGGRSMQSITENQASLWRQHHNSDPVSEYFPSR